VRARRLFEARLGRAIWVLVIISSLGWPGVASAEGILDFLLGGIRHALTTQPRETSPTLDPNDAPLAPDQSPAGRSMAFCVRLCDGRHFPMPRLANANPAHLCGAMCPAAKTKVFFGSEIRGAVSNDGSRYADLDKAFAYRERLMPGCTCNGRDAFGLAHIEIASDPTLRTGDLVAMPDGLKAYTGPKQRRGAVGSEFTPISEITGLTADQRHRLSATSVARVN
jgi:hypothetical protein